jgi:hypothetical protein
VSKSGTEQVGVAGFLLGRVHRTGQPRRAVQGRFDAACLLGIDQPLVHTVGLLQRDHAGRALHTLGAGIQVQLAGDDVVEGDGMALQQGLHGLARFQRQFQRGQRIAAQCTGIGLAQKGQAPAHEVQVRRPVRAECAVAAEGHLRQLPPCGRAGHRVGVDVAQLRAVGEGRAQRRTGVAVHQQHRCAAPCSGVGTGQANHAGTDDDQVMAGGKGGSGCGHRGKRTRWTVLAIVAPTRAHGHGCGARNRPLSAARSSGSR